METIKQFLKSNGIDNSDEGLKLGIRQIENLILDFSTKVREEQIIYCAVGSAHHTAINVRHVPEQLDNDLISHLNVCRVRISK